jgi:multidrug efflux pump subunit AcrB
VILALVASLFVAQLFTPWLSTFLLKTPKGVAPIPDSAPFDRREDSHDEERNPLLRTIRKAYVWSLPRVVAHPFAVVGAATALLVVSCLLLPKVGVEFFPKSDKPILFVDVELPRGTDASVTSQKVAEVVSELRKDPAVRSTSAMIGAPYSNISLGRLPHANGKDYGDVVVHLATPSTDEIARRLRASLAHIPGVRTTVNELYNGPPVPHPIIVRVQGDDYAKLAKHAEEIKARLRQVHGTINVRDSISESIPIANVDIDADRALRYGITPAQIGSTLRAVHGEDEVSSFRQDRDTVAIVIEGAEAGADPLGTIAETPVRGATGAAVPVLAVGDVSIARSSAELRRRNTRLVVDVTADVEGGTLPATVLAQMKPALDAMKWENGTNYSFGGEQAETEKSFKNLGIAAGATLIVIFVLLVLMFGSLTRSALVLAAVPFALIGVVWGLLLTHNAFGFMAFLGLVALIGVYVNHKIYLVERVEELLRRGVDWKTAIFRAGGDRLRPVVLTALTAILGLLPLTLGGGSFWSAFGWVNIFGLATSIPLSLVLVPALLAISFRKRSLAPASSVTDVTAMPDGTLVMVRPAMQQQPVDVSFEGDPTKVMHRDADATEVMRHSELRRAGTVAALDSNTQVFAGTKRRPPPRGTH